MQRITLQCIMQRITKTIRVYIKELQQLYIIQRSTSTIYITNNYIYTKCIELQQLYL